MKNTRIPMLDLQQKRLQARIKVLNLLNSLRFQIEKILIDKLRALKEDHRSENSNCRHCILLHRKSLLSVNLLIGDVMKYFTKEDALTKELSIFLAETEEITGVNISIKHSMTQKIVDEEVKCILYLPFLSVTKDVGYFKNNMVVHCSKNPSYYPTNKNLSRKVLIRVLPKLKSDLEYLKDLDQNFWRYFLKSEATFKTVYRSTLEESPVETFDDIESDVFDASIYILCLRRGYNHRYILRSFHTQALQMDFLNTTFIGLQKLSINFDSIKNFNTIVSVNSNFNIIV